MNDSPFTLTNSKTVYQNPWLSVREDQVIRPDGQPGIFGVVTMTPGSTILAITPQNTIFLTREYKYGIHAESFELVSGALNEGETPLQAAQRELEEEVGYTAQAWTDLGVINPFTTTINSPNYMFLAQNLTKTAQNLDSGEVLTLEEIPFAEAFEMVMSGKITHGASCVLILKAKNFLSDIIPAYGK